MVGLDIFLPPHIVQTGFRRNVHNKKILSIILRKRAVDEYWELCSDYAPMDVEVCYIMVNCKDDVYFAGWVELYLLFIVYEVYSTVV